MVKEMNMGNYKNRGQIEGFGFKRVLEQIDIWMKCPNCIYYQHA